MTLLLPSRLIGRAALPSALIAFVVCPDVLVYGQCCGAVQLSVVPPFSFSIGFDELQASQCWLEEWQVTTKELSSPRQSHCVELGSVASSHPMSQAIFYAMPLSPREQALTPKETQCCTASHAGSQVSDLETQEKQRLIFFALTVRPDCQGTEERRPKDRR